MSNLTEKFDELQAQLASQHQELMQLLGALSPSLTAIQTSTAATVGFAEQISNNLEDYLPELGRIASIQGTAEDVARLLGGPTWQAQTKNVLDELSAQGNNIIAILAAIGLIKLDTANIDTLNQNVSAWLAGTSSGIFLNESQNANNRLERILNYLYSAEFGDPPNSTLDARMTQFYTLFNSFLPELLNIYQETASSRIIEAQYLPMLEAIRDCGCDEPLTGICANYTITHPGAYQGVAPQDDAITYTDASTTSGYAAKALYSFPTFRNGASVASTSSPQRTWECDTGDAIYGAPLGMVDAAVANTGTKPLNLYTANYDAPDWLLTQIQPGECINLSSQDGNFWAVGVPLDDDATGYDCQLRLA